MNKPHFERCGSFWFVYHKRPNGAPVYATGFGRTVFAAWLDFERQVRYEQKHNVKCRGVL